MNLGFRAFISYSHKDKQIAHELSKVLNSVGIEPFLAHENIKVSDEWRIRILKELASTELFICLLTKAYYKSPWCLQESGVAAVRKRITIIPLSVDGSIPRGFISNVQSTKISPSNVSIENLLPSLIKHDTPKGLDLVIEIIGGSVSFRDAEANFRLILPYLGKLSRAQIQRLLQETRRNSQVHHATLCAREYVPPLLRAHGHLLGRKDLKFLRDVCAQYTSER